MSRWLANAAICLMALWVLGLYSVARGHDAPSGWVYPVECCGNGDCAEARPGKDQEHMTLVTKLHGERDISKVPPSRYRPSPDGKWHLCAMLRNEHVFCIFAPAGS